MGAGTWPPVVRALVWTGVALVMAGMVQPGADSGSAAQPARDAVVTAVGCDDDDRAMLDWAVAQTSRLPGGLPDIEVVFWPEDECGGAAGLYVREEATLYFCNTGACTVLPRQTMVHELTHAWMFDTLTDTQIAAFLDLRGIESWAPVDVAWWQSGQEQAAEILAWGLKGDLPYYSPWTRWEPCEELTEAFVLLAGFEPDGPFDACRP